MGHAEVAQAPGQAGHDGQYAVGLGGAEHVHLCGRGGSGLDQGEEAVDALGVLNGRRQAAGSAHGHDEDQHQHRHHHHGLHEIGGALRQEAAQERVDQHEGRRHDHHALVGQAEQVGKQLAAGAEALGRVDREEDNDNQGGQHHQGLVPALMIALGEEDRHGEGVYRDAVPPQTAGGDEEVQIGTQSKADAGPARVGKTRPVGKARQAHQQVAGHVRRFGAESRDPGAQTAAAQKIRLCVLVGAAGEHDADGDHRQHIQDHSQQVLNVCSIHGKNPP